MLERRLDAMEDAQEPRGLVVDAPDGRLTAHLSGAGGMVEGATDAGVDECDGDGCQRDDKDGRQLHLGRL